MNDEIIMLFYTLVYWQLLYLFMRIYTYFSILLPISIRHVYYKIIIDIQV